MVKKSMLTPDERSQLVLRLLSKEEPAARLARRAGVSEQTLCRWRDDFIGAGNQAMKGRVASAEQVKALARLSAEVAGRNQVIGELTIANRVLKKSRAPQADGGGARDGNHGLRGDTGGSAKPCAEGARCGALGVVCVQDWRSEETGTKAQGGASGTRREGPVFGRRVPLVGLQAHRGGGAPRRGKGYQQAGLQGDERRGVAAEAPDRQGRA